MDSGRIAKHVGFAVGVVFLLYGLAGSDIVAFIIGICLAGLFAADFFKP